MSEFKDTSEFVNTSEADRRAFVDCLDGVILGDVATVNEAVSRLELLDSPFVDDLPQKARWHEEILLDDVADDIAMECIVVASLRAYVYSGVPIDKNLVFIAASRVNAEDHELRYWLLSDSSLLDRMDNYGKNGLSEDEKLILKWRGLKALNELGLCRFTDKIRLAAINRKLSR